MDWKGLSGRPRSLMKRRDSPERNHHSALGRMYVYAQSSFYIKKPIAIKQESNKKSIITYTYRHSKQLRRKN